jgi:hypothetical protein
MKRPSFIVVGVVALLFVGTAIAQAQLVRCYVAPQEQFVTPFGEMGYRSVVNNYIYVTAGDWFDEYIFDGRFVSIVCVHAPQATQDDIAAASGIVTIGNAVDETQFHDYVNNTLINNLPNAADTKMGLEANGISTAWCSPTNTLKDCMTYIIDEFTIAQWANGTGNTEVLTFINNKLDTQMKDISPTVRGKVMTWIQNKGLTTSQFNNQSTVRQVLQYILSNIRFGKYRLSGEDF